VLGVEGIGGGARQCELVGRQRRPRSLQRAVDGRHRGVEQFGDLTRLPAQHLSQDQDGALPSRQVLKGCNECQPHRLSPDRHVCRVTDLGQHATVGNRFDPHLLGQGHAQGRRDGR
jgi:hypothetical protein